MRALAFYAVLALPTAALVQVGWGRGAALLYLAALAGAMTLLRAAWPRLRRALAPRATVWLALTLAALAIALAVAYPLLDGGGRRGGSDGDEQYEVAGAALVRSELLYAEPTYLGNPISVLPGALFMALPVALNGAMPALVWLWLAALAVWLARRRGATHALAVLGAMVLLSPATLYSLASGSDYLANSIAVMLLALALVGWPEGRGGRAIVAALLGVLLASRANFWFVLPLVAAGVAQRRGVARAARDMALTVAALAASVVPFYLADPARFTPLTTSNKLSLIAPQWPLFPALVLGATGLLSLLLALRGKRAPRALLLHGALVLLLPVLAGMAATSVRLGGWDLRYGSYALFALPWALVALLEPGEH